MPNKTFSSVIKIAPNAPLSCFYCPNIKDCGSLSSHPDIRWRHDDDEHWLVHITCHSCRCKWSICSICTNIKNVFRNKNSINNHRSRYHKRQQSSDNVNNDPAGMKRINVGINNDSAISTENEQNNVTLAKNINILPDITKTDVDGNQLIVSLPNLEINTVDTNNNIILENDNTDLLTDNNIDTTNNNDKDELNITNVSVSSLYHTKQRYIIILTYYC